MFDDIPEPNELSPQQKLVLDVIGGIINKPVAPILDPLEEPINAEFQDQIAQSQSEQRFFNWPELREALHQVFLPKSRNLDSTKEVIEAILTSIQNLANGRNVDSILNSRRNSLDNIKALSLANFDEEDIEESLGNLVEIKYRERRVFLFLESQFNNILSSLAPDLNELMSVKDFWLIEDYLYSQFEVISSNPSLMRIEEDGSITIFQPEDFDVLMKNITKRGIVDGANRSRAYKYSDFASPNPFEKLSIKETVEKVMTSVKDANDLQIELRSRNLYISEMEIPRTVRRLYDAKEALLERSAVGILREQRFSEIDFIKEFTAWGEKNSSKLLAQEVIEYIFPPEEI